MASGEQPHNDRRLAELVRLATIAPRELLAETRAGLLLVDVQNRFIIGSDPARPAGTTRVLGPIESLLRLARAREIPRFYVTAGHAQGISESAPALRRLAAMGSDIHARLDQPSPPPRASEIPPSIAPRPGEIHLTKWRFSAFFETGLEPLLRGAGVETLVLGGVASYGCIVATYLDACARGFFPLLCVEAIDGARAERHQNAMDFMGANHHIGLSEVLTVWEPGPATPTGD